MLYNLFTLVCCEFESGEHTAAFESPLLGVKNAMGQIETRPAFGHLMGAYFLGRYAVLEVKA